MKAQVFKITALIMVICVGLLTAFFGIFKEITVNEKKENNDFPALLLNKDSDDSSKEEDEKLEEFKLQVDEMIAIEAEDKNCTKAELTSYSDTNRLIIKSEREELEEFEAVSYINGYNDLHIMQFETDEECDKALEYYEDKDYVEYVQEDGICESVDYNPMQEVSDEFGYTALRTYLTDNNINYTNQITVAVVDSGVENDHPLLQGRVQPTGFNSIDENDDCYDDRGHGTHVAGIIAANTEDNVVIKPYKVLNAKGQGTELQVYTGIIQAVNDGVDIINLSLSIIDESDVLHDGVKAAYDAGIVTVAAAGNNGISLDQVYTSPACFDEVICVMSCGNNKYVSEFSNYGSYCDLAAPGEKIVSSWLNGTYEAKSGTSMATPFIVAATAYILSEYPDYTQADVLKKLLENVKPCYSTPVGRYINAEFITREKIVSPNPKFSYYDSFFTEPFLLSLTCDKPNAEIYYTTTSMAAGEYVLYEEPITINHDMDVTAYTIVDGGTKSNSMTMAYTKMPGNAADFTVDSDGTLTGYTGTDMNPVVPLKVNNIYVTSIDERAFSGNTNLQSIGFLARMVNIKDSAFEDCTNLEYVRARMVTSIGDKAFLGCTKLSRIAAENTVYIGNEAFYNCENLKNVDFAGLENIGYSAFENCISLTSIGNDINKIIDSNAFKNSAITGLNLTQTTAIGDYAFSDCSNLASFNAPMLTKLNTGVLYNCNKITVLSLESITSIDNEAFSGNTYLEKIYAPKTTQIGESTFKDCTSLRDVTFDSLTTVGDYAFYNTAITNGTFPNVTSIGKYSFYNTQIGEAVFDKLSNISDYTFGNCENIKKLSFKKATEINMTAFKGCTGVETMHFPGAKSFRYEYSTDIKPLNETFPLISSFDAPNIENIPDYTFKNADYQINFEFNNLKSIGDYAFYQSEIETIPLSNTPPEIGRYAFYGCPNLTTADVSGNIGDYAFYNCPLLADVYIKNLSYLGEKAFGNCPMLGNFIISSAQTGVPDFDFSVLEGSTDNIAYFGLGYSNTLKCNGEDVPLKDILPSIKSFIVSSKSLPAGFFTDCTTVEDVQLDLLTTVPADLFKNCVNLKTVSLNGATSLSPGAFNGATSISTIFLNCIQVIPNYAFQGCTSLTTVGNFPEVTVIGAYAFEDTSVERVAANKLHTVGDYAFRNSKLKVFDAINSKSLGTGVFEGCYNLTQIKTGVSYLNANSLFGADVSDGDVSEFTNLHTFIAGNLTEIPENFFSGSSLTTVNIENATKVGANAFKNVTGLTTFDAPALKEIDDSAFYGCTALTKVTSTVLESIGDRAFENCTALTTCNIDKIIHLDNYAFNGCTAYKPGIAFVATIEYLGSKALNSTIVTSSAGLNFTSLKTVEANGFDGISSSIYWLPNVVNLYDVPDSGEILIGSVTENINTCATKSGKIYAPAENEVVKNYYNGAYPYVELNSTTAIKTDIPEIFTPANIKFVNFAVRGFNLTYQWYGARSKDLSDAVALEYENERRFYVDGYYQYPYFFCIAKSTENGNTIEIQSNTLLTYEGVFERKENSIELVTGDYILTGLENINEESIKVVFSVSDGYSYKLKPSYESQNVKYYGSGTEIQVYYGDTYCFSTTLLVRFDINGDGVVDILDYNDFYNYYFFVLPEQEELYYLGNYRAADMNGNNEWDDEEEQLMMEKVLD